MLIALVVILVWTIIGGVVALWLCDTNWQGTYRETWAVAVVCGPVVWLFVVVALAAECIGRP